ncbi:hypothetical protein PspLS_10757 [Pyricularia sp. CBS 133598]|nr:hypothetical protein PspLS_10757 [Pyricularia sp. CBS 133598]
MNTAVEQHDPCPEDGCGMIATTSPETVVALPRLRFDFFKKRWVAEENFQVAEGSAKIADESAKPDDGSTSNWSILKNMSPPSDGTRPPSTEQSTAALRPPSLYPPSGTPKSIIRSPFKEKVRSGCKNCKLRRIKCDEKRPACTQCTRSKKICIGYPQSKHQPDEIQPPNEQQLKGKSSKKMLWQKPLVPSSYVSQGGHWKTMADKYDFDEDLDIVDPEGYEVLLGALQHHILRDSELAVLMNSPLHFRLGSGAKPSEPAKWPPYAINSVRGTDHSYSRATENYTNMERILKQLDNLREHGFASDFLSILVARPGAVAEIVPIYRASLVEVINAIKYLQNFMKKPWELLDSTDKIRPPGLESMLQSALDNISAKIGKAFENQCHVHPEWDSDLRIMADCQWLVRILDLGLISYSGSHISRFDEELIPQGQRHANLSPGVIEVPASDKYCSAQLSLQRLACLDGLLDRQVWVLRRKLDPRDGNEALSILTTMPLFADLWGPVYTVRHPDDDGKILQHNTAKGVIRRQKSEKVHAQKARCILEYDEAVVPCHWESAPKHFLSRCAGGVRRLLKPPKSFLRDGDLLLIGAAEPDPEAYSGLHPNKGCKYTPEAFFADSIDMLGVPGTRPAKWVKDGLEVGAGVELSMFSFSVTGKAKKIPGTTLKQRILTKWTQAPARANPWILHHLLAVEVSHCTGNARRIALRDMLFRDELKEYLDVQMPSWANTDWGMALRQAIESNDREELLRFWKTHQHSRQNVGQLIASILELLDDTGNDGKSFRVALVHKNMEHLIKFPLEENSWASVLGDSDLSATYALVTHICLSRKHDRNGEKDYTRCSQDDNCLNKAYTCLLTSIVVPKGAEKYVQIRGDRDENIYMMTKDVLMLGSDLRSTAEKWVRKISRHPMQSEAKDSTDIGALEVTLKSRQRSYGGMSKPRSKVPCQRLELPASAIEIACQLGAHEQPASRVLFPLVTPEPDGGMRSLQKSRSRPFSTIIDKNCIDHPGDLILPSHPATTIRSTSATIEGARVNLNMNTWAPAKEVVEVMAGDSSERH